MENKSLLVVFLTILAILTVAVLPFIAGCTEPSTEPTTTPPDSTAAPAPAETIELKYLSESTDVPERGYMNASVNTWGKNLESITNGRVKVTYLIGAVTMEGTYDSLIDGAGDLACKAIMANTERFPTLEIMTVPDLFTNCMRPSQVAWQMYQQLPEVQEEFSDVKILSMYATTPSPPGVGFATADKPVYSLEDFKGLKLASGGKWGTKVAEALGPTIVSVPTPGVYEAMQRGIIDGSFMDPEMLIVFKIGELTKYWHNVGAMFVPTYFAMNWDTWNSLPDDIKKVIEEENEIFPDRVDSYAMEASVKGFELYPDVVQINYEPEEQARWREVQDPVQDEYVAMLAEKGIDGQKILDKMNELFAEYAEAQ